MSDKIYTFVRSMGGSVMELGIKYAVVTGASSGIGYQYAREMAARGYSLVIVSNKNDELKEKAECLRMDFCVDVIPVAMDLGVQEAAKTLYDECKSRNLEVDVLINNAGVYHDRDFLQDTPQFNSMILNLHVYTPAMLEYWFGKDMVSRHRGYILNMSSITSEIAVQRLATYSATKSFLKNFSRSTHVEMKGLGVNVTCVRPGAVATGLYNLKPSALKAGLALGYIVTPEKLAAKGVKAMMKGRSRITPGIASNILIVLVKLLPTSALRLIRKLKLF